MTRLFVYLYNSDFCRFSLMYVKESSQTVLERKAPMHLQTPLQKLWRHVDKLRQMGIRGANSKRTHGQPRIVTRAVLDSSLNIIGNLLR